MNDEEFSSFVRDLIAGRREPLRVLLCPDRPGWAFDNIANNLLRSAPSYLQVEKFFLGHDEDRDLSRFYTHVSRGNFDIVHFFWREDLFLLLRPETILSQAKRMDLDIEDVVNMVGRRTFTSTVYDHLFLAERDISERVLSYHMIDAYSVASSKLYHLYSSHPDLPPPASVTPDGVNLSRFHPASDRTGNDTPVIGWVGNSAWGQDQGGDPKGYYRLFEPTLDVLRSRGIAFDVQVADPQVRRIPFDEMPDYYRSIDILVCTSAMEGTPNPVLEAMASGIAVVSTDVGIVEDAFGRLQKRYIVREPNPGTMADALTELLVSKDKRQALASENIEHIRDWSWDRQVTAWWSFWLAAYRKAGDPRMARRRTRALLDGCISYLYHEEEARRLAAAQVVPIPKPRRLVAIRRIAETMLNLR